MYSGSRAAARCAAPPASTAPIAGRDDIGDQARLARLVLPRDHHGLRHARVRGQHGLDLTGLDPEPADLDLLVGPPGEHQLAARASTGPGPRSGTSAPRPARTGTPQTAPPSAPGRPRYPRARPAPGHVQLPGHPGRHRGQATRPARSTRVLAIGRRSAPPRVRGLAARSSSAHTVASVGP